MPKFIVSIREVHVQPISVEADNKKAAMEKVESGEGDYNEGQIEYSHTLDSDTWTVEEVKEK